MPQQEREQLQGRVKLLLLWVAAADGVLEESELAFVSAQFPDVAASIDTKAFMSVIVNSDVTTIEKAIRTVADESRELRTAFLDLAISVSMVDSDMAMSENHILRFYADALHLGQPILEKRFQAMTGNELPLPGDPGSLQWWSESRNEDTPTLGMTVAQAHSVLGVALNATAEDIELAYQKLAVIFQVDREEAMSAHALSETHSNFARIQRAYHLLRSSE